MPNDHSLSHAAKALLLKKIPIVGGLPGPKLAVVAEYAKERYFAAGEALLTEGRPVTASYCIVGGEVTLRRGGQDMRTVGPGAGLGGLGILARNDSNLDAVCATDTLTLELDAEAIFELFEDHFTIVHHVLRDLSRGAIELLQSGPRAFESPPPRLGLPVHDRELDLVERIFFLRHSSVFSRSSINALAELARGLTEVRFRPGTLLWSDGDAARSVFLVVDGTVRCHLAATGFEFQAGPGDPLGAADAMGELPRWFQATTETPVTVLAGGVEGLLDVFEDNVDMAMDYMAVMARWVLDMVDVPVVSAVG